MSKEDVALSAQNLKEMKEEEVVSSSAVSSQEFHDAVSGKLDMVKIQP